MIYTENTKKALKLAYEKHAGQLDKAGLPYIFHPFHLAEQMDDEDSTVVALLHDVVEDTDTTIEDLAEMGFSDQVLKALQLLTHQKTVDYFEYIKTISANEIATKVKIADLTHNSDLTRLNAITEKDKDRVAKYKECLDYLTKSKVSTSETSERFYRFDGGIVFKRNTDSNLFYYLGEQGNWISSGWVMTRFFDPAYDFTELTKEEVDDIISCLSNKTSEPSDR